MTKSATACQTAAGVLALGFAGVASAEPQSVGLFKDWSVMVQEAGNDKICFAVAQAQDKSPKSVNHGEIFFMVATWKSGVATDQPSFRAGYNLKDAPGPVVRIGSQKWDMYVSDNEAFIENAAAEQSLVAAMRSGADMRIAATSGRGTATNYIFSLSGVSAALDRAQEACK
ncbi:MAG: invasion associated locus B family protein [Parvularculaceae bacterium]|nr:invasion associated locus B family protein [Parvularculaceae bacterium]